jgi:hypothetical protein
MTDLRTLCLHLSHDVRGCVQCLPQIVPQRTAVVSGERGRE